MRVALVLCVVAALAGIAAAQTCLVGSGLYGPSCLGCPTCYQGVCSDGNSGNGTCLCNPGYTSATCGVLYAGAVATLYAGGAMNNSVPYLMQWNGTSWSSVGGVTPDNSVTTVSSNNGILYVSGTFANIGGTSATRIAAWNGASWSALGSGLSNSASRFAFNGTTVYVAGPFVTAGGVTVNYVARWNGTAWSALGSGTDSVSTSGLAMWQNNLYVGGRFNSPASKIAKWNGASWSGLGTGVDDYVIDIVPFRNLLYVSGNFAIAGGLSASKIAAWNGTTWSTVGVGLNNQVTFMIAFNGLLYVAGQFGGNAKYVDVATSTYTIIANINRQGLSLASYGSYVVIGQLPTQAIYAYNGSLTALGVAQTNNVNSLTTIVTCAAGYYGPACTACACVLGVCDQGISGTGACTCNTGATGTLCNACLPGYFGPSCSACTCSASFGCYDGVSGNGTCYCALPGFNCNGGSALLYLVGDYTSAGTTTATTIAANRIAAWNGAIWTPLGTGLNAGVSAVAAGAGYVYAGGSFSSAGGVSAAKIARWNGTAWSALGSGLNAAPGIMAVDPITGYLYVAGISIAGGISVNGIAQWNGTAWSAMSSGTNSINQGLSAYNGSVCLSGRFTVAGGTTVNYITRWNGTAWLALGTGANDFSFACLIDGTNIYAGGQFGSVNGVAASDIARWNGTAWSAMGTGMNNYVQGLTAFGGNVYASGNFGSAGGVSASYIAKWNGTRWSALGSGMSSSVWVLANQNGILYASGGFLNAGGNLVNRVAQWNGTAWRSLSTGFSSVNSIATMTVCNAGYYGSNCAACPCTSRGNCSDGFLGTGACTCSAGWTGTTCNSCASGYYGASCTACPNCGSHGTCNQGLSGDGACTCEGVWTGALCDDCVSGYFGPSCVPCPSMYGVDCDSGASGTGAYASCVSGWSGAYCNISSSHFALAFIDPQPAPGFPYAASALFYGAGQAVAVSGLGVVFLYNCVSGDPPLCSYLFSVTYSGAASDDFGASLAMSGSPQLLVVGAPGYDSGNGAVFVYDCDFFGATCSLVRPLCQSTQYGTAIGFGASVAVDQSLVVVGSSTWAGVPGGIDFLVCNSGDAFCTQSGGTLTGASALNLGSKVAVSADSMRSNTWIVTAAGDGGSPGTGAIGACRVINNLVFCSFTTGSSQSDFVSTDDGNVPNFGVATGTQDVYTFFTTTNYGGSGNGGIFFFFCDYLQQDSPDEYGSYTYTPGGSCGMDGGVILMDDPDRPANQFGTLGALTQDMLVSAGVAYGTVLTFAYSFNIYSASYSPAAASRLDVSDVGGVSAFAASGPWVTWGFDQTSNVYAAHCPGGMCTCQTNWEGANCDVCDAARYAADCSGECPLCIHGTCNSGTLGDGLCTCESPWTGMLCDTCEPGYAGAACELCTCLSGTCDGGVAGTGTCSACFSGYYGANCDATIACQNGVPDEGVGGSGTCIYCNTSWFGSNCDQACTCNSGGGECNGGVSGDGHCLFCDSGYWGTDCDGVCDCGGHGTCSDGVLGTGECTCDAGWSPSGGLSGCVECSAGYFGPDCSLCQCVYGTCSEGLSGDGSCYCNEGWSGTLCDRCAAGFGGPSCVLLPSYCQKWNMTTFARPGGV